MPSENTAARVSEPPVKVLMKPKMVPSAACWNSSSACGSTPGVGM
jgi:hypothetical protein